MQKTSSNKPNKPASFFEILFAMLARVGNILIIAFGLIFYGIRKLIYAIKKQKHEQTLYEFIKKLDNHLNPDGKAHTTPPKRESYSAAKVSPVKTNISATAAQKPKEFSKTPQRIVRAKSKKYGLKLNIPIKKFSHKIVMATLALVVVISSIFVFKGFADKKKEDLASEPQLPMMEAAPATAEAGLNLSVLSTSIGKLMLQQEYSTEFKTIYQWRSENTVEVCLDEPQSIVTETEQTQQTEGISGDTALDPEPTSSGELEQDIMLHLNDTNEVVPQVQEALMGLHYMDADEPTDFYGQQTEYAIQLFQRGNGLMVDGVAGYETLTLLFSGEAEQYLVHKGDKGWDIKQVQKRLKELGYLTGGYTDERYDDATYSAIREFQGRNKLSQDGVIGHNTLQTLFNGDAEPARSYKPPASDGGTTSDGGGGGDSSNISYDANSASDFVAFAKSIMNKGYTYLLGGKSPPSMDCSGFVYYCLNQTGNNINYRTSAAWAKSSHDTISSIHDAKPGDILCFEGHVAICIGGGKMIDSSSSQNAIRITNYESSSYWNKKWICAKRVFD
jgi:peptidoglycan hydrolase-like protein with peptidoglycan-binding domain